jgi:adenine-specific DNA glycosylase
VFAFALYRDLAGGKVHGEASDHRRWLVARRPAEGLLGGLWEFPLVPGEPGDDPAAVAEAAFGLSLERLASLAAVAHVFTHLRLTAVPVVGQVCGDDAQIERAVAAHGGLARYHAWRWVELGEMGGADLPHSVLMEKLVGRVDHRDARPSAR